MSPTFTVHERICAITAAIKSADRDLRKRFPILKFQSAIGVVWFGSVISIAAISSGLYLQSAIPAWLCIAINAVCFAIVREIEHDLIHNLYFATRKRIQNLMMLAVWPILGNLPHPWYRRKMHLLHHRTSGQDEDFEERLIGNGLKFGPLKLLAMLEPGLASLFRQKEFRGIPFFSKREFFVALMPVAMIYLVVLYGLIATVFTGLACQWTGLTQPGFLARLHDTLATIGVIWLFPNMLRQVCLQIISSNMHYHGDVDDRLKETQVMNAWWLLPLNLFTCNFGSTHSIHHFMVSQPFYLRQLVARAAHRAFREHGLRYNDVGTVFRGNRYAKA